MSFKKTILKECIASDKTSNNGAPYEKVKEIADHILSSSKHRPQVAIICGSGLGGIADKLVNSEVHPYESIPGFPVTTVSGHAGRMVLGLMAGVPVVCMQGRIHYYEGHPMWKIALCIRVLKLMGVSGIIITNAAGGLNPAYKEGDIMLIKDHLNLHNFGGDTPLRETNDSRFGPQYPAMNRAYDLSLRQKAKKIASELGFSDCLYEGVFSMTTGPMFETPTELRALRILGVDAVGMSTIPEVITAVHCGLKVFAFSLITNVCITEYDSDVSSHADIEKIGIYRQKQIHDLVSYIVGELGSGEMVKSS